MINRHIKSFNETLLAQTLMEGLVEESCESWR